MTFIEMMKKWVALDYHTDGIKAEVVIDTLISEFLPDLVSQAVGERVELFCKEFPIYPLHAVWNGKDYRLNFTKAGEPYANPARIDYVCRSGNVFYIVELKTTNDSIDGKQFANYRNYCRTESFSGAYPEEFFELYQRANKKRPFTVPEGYLVKMVYITLHPIEESEEKNSWKRAKIDPEEIVELSTNGSFYSFSLSDMMDLVTIEEARRPAWDDVKAILRTIL